MNVQPRITVKDCTVTVRSVQQSTTVGGMDIKATQQRMQAAKEGDVGKALTGGVEYFHGVVTAMRGLLQSRLQP